MSGRARRALVVAAAGGVGLVAALLGAAAALTTRLDRSPILGSEPAERTWRALASAAERAPGPWHGALRAGWARAEITPPLGTPTLGYGARHGRGTGSVADPLFARAVALSAGSGPPLVILSADLCLWSSGLSERVAAELADALPRERLYVGATHTHNGPGGFVRAPGFQWGMGRFDARIPPLLTRGAVAAVRGALASLAPARVRVLELDGSPWIENRSRPGVPLDDRLVVLELARDDGARAALVVFAAHATAIAPDTVVTSGDYPGALVRGLRRRGFDAALFLAAETGQAGPRLEANAPRAGTQPAVRLGDAMAEAVARATDADATGWRREVSLAVLRSEVKLPPWRVPLGRGRALRPEVAAWLLGRAAPLAHVQALRLDDTLFVGHSFELSAVAGRALARRARERGVRLVLTGLNGDHDFYVVPEADYDLPVYESGMTFFGPGLAPYLDEVTERVMQAMVRPAE